MKKTNEVKIETTVSLDGNVTVSHEGVVTFNSTEPCSQGVFPRETNRTGRMNYRTDGNMMFVPARMLRAMRLPVLREKIHEEKSLRVEMTSRSFIVHVKLPVTMETVEIEDRLDDNLDTAVEVIMRKKEALECSIL